MQTPHKIGRYLCLLFLLKKINSFIVCRDNSKLSSCGGDRQVFYWDVATGRVIRKFRGHDSEVRGIYSIAHRFGVTGCVNEFISYFYLIFLRSTCVCFLLFFPSFQSSLGECR